MRRITRTLTATLCSLALATAIPARTAGQDASPRVAALLNQVEIDSLAVTIQALAAADGHENRATFTPGNRWAVQYLKARFEAIAGLTAVGLDTFFIPGADPPFNQEPLFNVVATLEGVQSPDTLIILGGHLDATSNRDSEIDWNAEWRQAKAPGADDNASGLAAILEIARILSAPENEFRPKYTIQFVAFGAEEFHPAYPDHHLGSRHFARQAWVNRQRIEAVYVMDMIGYNDTGNIHQSIVADTRSRPLGESLLATRARYSIAIHTNEPPFPASTYSDHEAFWTYRYKALLLIENAPPWNNNANWYTANPYYHKQSDTFETVNMEQVALVTRLVLAAVAEGEATPTAVPEQETDVPLAFALQQNYPNPFNAGTLLRYELGRPVHVRLQIFDLQGRLVATLVDGQQAAGSHAVQWQARAGDRELPSGIYFSVLQAGKEKQMRKLVLAR